MKLEERNATLVALGCASEEQMAELGENVLQAKGAGTVQIRCVAGEVKKLEDGTFRFKISDEAPDRMGDIVRQGGMDAGNFQRNPVFLLGHDQDSLPIGKGVAIERDGKETYLRVKFAEGYPQAEIAASLVEQGIMRATSIGFMPKTGGVYSPKNEDERKELGLGKYGVEFRSWELLEVSLVTVPANPNALAASLGAAVERGICTQADAETFKAKALPTERDMLKRIGAKAQPAYARGGIVPGNILAGGFDGGKEAHLPLVRSITANGQTYTNGQTYAVGTAPGIDCYDFSFDVVLDPPWVARLEKSIAELPDRIAQAITKALPQGGTPRTAEEPKARRQHYDLGSLLHVLNEAADKRGI